MVPVQRLSGARLPAGRERNSLNVAMAVREDARGPACEVRVDGDAVNAARPSQNRSGATSDDPAVPNKRTVVPFAKISPTSLGTSGCTASCRREGTPSLTGFAGPLTTVRVNESGRD